MIINLPVLHALLDASRALQKAARAARDAGMHDLANDIRESGFDVGECIASMSITQPEEVVS